MPLVDREVVKLVDRCNLVMNLQITAGVAGCECPLAVALADLAGVVVALEDPMP